MKKSGSADLPLYSGPIPYWLSQRMNALCLGITEAILQEYGPDELLRRLADPFWYPRSKELGLFVCGGKGKASLQTPAELLRVGEQTGLDGAQLAYCSRLSAKVDNTAV